MRLPVKIRFLRFFGLGLVTGSALNMIPMLLLKAQFGVALMSSSLLVGAVMLVASFLVNKSPEA